MYNYEPAVTVVTKGGNTYEFSAEKGTSAKRSLEQKIAIDTIDAVEFKRTFIPYEAIDHAVIDGVSQQGLPPVDANCVSRDAQPGTLSVTNTGDNTMLYIALKLGQPGTYSGYAFTYDDSEDMGDGWYALESRIDIDKNETITISGIPDGTEYYVSIPSEQPHEGTVPAEVTVIGGK